MLLKCHGVSYDDRVRKECESLYKLGYQTTIYALENSNIDSVKFEFSCKTKVVTKSLLLRKVNFPGMTLFRLAEFIVRALPLLVKKHKIVWVHDPVLFPFIPILLFLKRFGRVDRIVWDQHELPPKQVEKNFLVKKFFSFFMRNVDELIVANPERGAYIERNYSENIKFNVVRNYVDEVFIDTEPREIDSRIIDWLDGERYFLLQSGAYRNRHFMSVATALCQLGGNTKVVVLGNYDQALVEELSDTFNNFNDVFYFVGMVPHLRIVDYLSQAKASLIFYNWDSPNSLLCEPNRLYYALSRSIPVICGSNPTMSSTLVKGNGVVIKGDGRDKNDILEGVAEFDEIYNKGGFFGFDNISYAWKNNEDVIANLL